VLSVSIHMAAMVAAAGQRKQQQEEEEEAAAAVLSSQLIWRTLEQNPGLPTYDVFVSPQLVMTKNHSILSFVGARKCSTGINGCEDDTGRHDVLVKRSDDAGRSWQHAVLVHSESTANTSVVIGNPACVLDGHTGRLLVFMCRNNTNVLLSHSDTNGASWTTARDVTTTVKAQDWGWYATTFSGIMLKHQSPGQEWKAGDMRRSSGSL
jgi:hypothetical protein